MSLGQCPFSYALTGFSSHETQDNIPCQITLIQFLHLDTNSITKIQLLQNPYFEGKGRKGTQSVLEARYVHWTHQKTKHNGSTNRPGEGDSCAQGKEGLLSCSGSEPSTAGAKILKGLEPV